MHAPRTYEEFSVVVFWDLPWPLGDLDLGARRAKDDLCHRGAAQDWGCVPNPIEGAAKELPGLRYLVRIRLVAYQDWGLAPSPPPPSPAHPRTATSTVTTPASTCTLVPQATMGALLVFVNANREIRKRTDTIVTFTQEYSRVSYLSSGKQWF